MLIQVNSGWLRANFRGRRLICCAVLEKKRHGQAYGRVAVHLISNCFENGIWPEGKNFTATLAAAFSGCAFALCIKQAASAITACARSYLKHSKRIRMDPLESTFSAQCRQHHWSAAHPPPSDWISATAVVWRSAMA
jgi:hypothetical protein